MSQFYADGVPSDAVPRAGDFPVVRNNATVVKGMRRTAVRRTNPDKYYLADTGMICALKAKNDAEKGFLLENTVYMELRRFE